MNRHVIKISKSGSDTLAEDKMRIIQEYVPGKQITLAHIIANPQRSIYQKLGLDDNKNAIGILTITPSEASIIAADIATKSSGVEIGFLDRFSGSLVLIGDISSIEAALKKVIETMENVLNFSTAKITRS